MYLHAEANISDRQVSGKNNATLTTHLGHLQVLLLRCILLLSKGKEVSMSIFLSRARYNMS